MSVLNSLSSFSPAAFSLLTGLAIGGTLCAIGDLKSAINNISMDDPAIEPVKKGILDRVKIIFTAWSATSVLAAIGLMSRHPGFGISAVASSVVVMLNIKWEVQNGFFSSQSGTSAKLAGVVKMFFIIAIPAIALLTLTLLRDSLDQGSKNLTVL